MSEVAPIMDPDFSLGDGDKIRTCEIRKPVLADNEKVSFYEARSTKDIQPKGHVGVIGPFSGFVQFYENEWDKVVEFISKHRHHPYCSVTATINIIDQQPERTIFSTRYHDVFLRDDSIDLPEPNVFGVIPPLGENSFDTRPSSPDEFDYCQESEWDEKDFAWTQEPKEPIVSIPAPKDECTDSCGA